jgi:predicted ATP-binding protein involved in virulence
MLIKSIEIENYRRFEHYTCSFDSRFTLLMGPNGTGKTSLLNAVFRGLSAYAHSAGFGGDLPDQDVRRVDTVDPGSSRWRTAVYPSRINLQVHFADEDRLLTAERDSQQYRWFSNDPRYSMLSTTTWQFLAGKTKAWLDPTNTEAIPIFARFGASNTVNGSGRPGAVAAPFESKAQVLARVQSDAVDVAQLAQWFQYNELRTLQEGQQPLTYRVAREAVLTAIHASDIKYVVRDNQLMLLHKDQGWRPFDQLSDGQRRIAAIFCELALRCASLNSQLGEDCIVATPGVVTIDELDLHLHPLWQRSIVGDLCKTFPKLQFIAASHSPFLLQAAYEYGKVLDVSSGSFVEPTDRSIEDIAESVMGVADPQRGQRFLELKRLAQEFYELLESKPSNAHEESALKDRLDEAMAPFANDPAAAAWLEQRRIVAGH